MISLLTPHHAQLVTVLMVISSRETEGGGKSNSNFPDSVRNFCLILQPLFLMAAFRGARELMEKAQADKQRGVFRFIPVHYFFLK